jgi:hypothetical protein
MTRSLGYTMDTVETVISKADGGKINIEIKQKVKAKKKNLGIP